MITACFEEHSIIAGDFVPELRLRKEGAVKPAESFLPSTGLQAGLKSNPFANRKSAIENAKSVDPSAAL
jgi:hypothetical protein